MQAALCTPALQHIRKVALLFLTIGSIHHDQLWRDWLDDAVNVLPARAVADTNKTSDLLRSLTEDCGNQRWQALFSIYTHPKPQFNGFDEDSIFAGTEVGGRVEVRGHAPYTAPPAISRPPGVHFPSWKRSKCSSEARSTTQPTSALCS